MEENVMITIQEWFQSITLFEALFIVFAVTFLIVQLIKLWKPLRKFVDFVDTMQKLPLFMENTDRKFDMLFEHLNIDPDDVNLEKSERDGTE